MPDSPELRESVVSAVWRRAAGAGLREHTIPGSLEGKRLKLFVRDKIWKKNLESMAPQLLFRLNALMDARLVDYLEFEVAENKFEADKKETLADEAIPAVSAELVEKSEAIKDPALREQFLKSAAVYLANQKH
ncbi:MAG: DUF721 domain-containing protein [Pyrinomonadaceae bacterium]|nr:DUF721 domain-containing protein [Pyrinomonadaceae bacterium]